MTAAARPTTAAPSTDDIEELTAIVDALRHAEQAVRALQAIRDARIHDVYQSGAYTYKDLARITGLSLPMIAKIATQQRAKAGLPGTPGGYAPRRPGRVGHRP
jgi:hypothetical protein